MDNIITFEIKIKPNPKMTLKLTEYNELYEDVTATIDVDMIVDYVKSVLHEEYLEHLVEIKGLDS